MPERRVDLTKAANWLSGEALRMIAEKHGIDPDDEAFRKSYEQFVEESVAGATVGEFLPVIFESYLKRALRVSDQVPGS